MSHKILKIENLGKKYLVHHKAREPYSTIRDLLAKKTMAFSRHLFSDSNKMQQNLRFEELWALKDISVDVNQGEVVGIIGRNGAGKSTLLKILSRITEPTIGSVRIKGRVASLLEVGTGFHPELTGRENIFLNGAILGMSKTEIKYKFDEIVAFSETEKFLDTPIKRYSSGMRVRLAFSVAAHLDPEILLIDEVLAVGDAGFQKKCLGKMSDVSKEGRTVLFVSHNMMAVQKLCERVIWLADGQIRKTGKTDTVVSKYLNTAITDTRKREWVNMDTAPGNSEVRIRNISVKSAHNNLETALYVDNDMEIGIDFWSLKSDQELALTMHFITSDGIVAFSTSTLHDSDLQERIFDQGPYQINCHIPANLLNEGKYIIKLLIVKNQNRVVFKMEDALAFELIDRSSGRYAYFGKRPGIFAPSLNWGITKTGA